MFTESEIIRQETQKLHELAAVAKAQFITAIVGGLEEIATGAVPLGEEIAKLEGAALQSAAGAVDAASNLVAIVGGSVRSLDLASFARQLAPSAFRALLGMAAT